MPEMLKILRQNIGVVVVVVVLVAVVVLRFTILVSKKLLSCLFFMEKTNIIELFMLLHWTGMEIIIYKDLGGRGYWAGGCAGQSIHHHNSAGLSCPLEAISQRSQ